MMPRHFAWQAWHSETSTFVLRGRRGTRSHEPPFCVAGVDLWHSHLCFARFILDRFQNCSKVGLRFVLVSAKAQSLHSAWFGFCSGLIKISVWVVLCFRAC